MVDIIMPTYNPHVFLIRRAIQSIIHQTYSDWTLYIVKDGGDTDVQSIVNEFRDARIKLSELAHQGKPLALNYGISQGKAKFIAYLDDDDIWYPNHLSDAITYMLKTDAGFVYTNCHEVVLSTEKDSFKEISRRNLHRGVMTHKTLWYISHINVVHEREILYRTGLYDESRNFFIDWDMFLRLAKYTKPHHLNIYTGEHFIYLNKQGGESNIISSIHKKSSHISMKMHREMFMRAFEVLTPDDFAEIAMDWDKLSKKAERLEILQKSYRSRIKSGIRWAYNKLKP